MHVMDCQAGTDPSLNSLGSKFSSQGHFHSLQLLNVPQFLFCQVVRLKTAPRGNLPQLKNMLKMEALQG